MLLYVVVCNFQTQPCGVFELEQQAIDKVLNAKMQELFERSNPEWRVYQLQPGSFFIEPWSPILCRTITLHDKD